MKCNGLHTLLISRVIENLVDVCIGLKTTINCTAMFAYRFIERSKSWRNCLKEVWYMEFTKLISTIKKYRMLPRVATGRNSSRAELILISVSAAVCSFWLTSWAVTLVMLSTLIRSSSSTKEPFEQNYTI